MAIQWLYQREGRPSKPVDSKELRRLAEAGIVTPNTLVRQGGGLWVRAENVRGLFQRSTASPSSSPRANPPGPPPPSRMWRFEMGGRIFTTKQLLTYGIAVLLLAMVGEATRDLTRTFLRDGHSPPTPPSVSEGRDGASPSASDPAAESDSARFREGWELVAEPPAATWGADDEVVATAEEMQAMGVDGPSQAETGNVKTLELADLAELVGPSVVQVNVTGPEGAFTGSGFVLDKEGTIVTNFHVIEDATAGRIVFSDKTSAPIAGYLGVWPEKDIALVRVECPPEKLHPLRLATSAPRQGERVAAFGSPLGLQQSVSEGIVSAVRESEELRTLGPIDVNARLIQTTTPISHGNSGGPLVDMKRMVVGVNTLTFRPLGGENVNFAVAVAELPPLLLAKNETPSPLPASDPSANGVRRILRRARDHVDAGEYDRAIADYTEAIRLDPKDAEAFIGRGEAYRNKGDYDMAIADYTQAIRLDPKNAEAFTRRGEAYDKTGQRAAAERDFAQAKRLGYTP